MFFSGLICLVLLPFVSHAQVDYISLHEIETAERQPLSVKLNVVETHGQGQLYFTLLNRNAETMLDYQRLNNYMLRLRSPHYIIGQASILVYEFKQNAWRRTHTVDISNSLIASPIDKKTLAEIAKIQTQCLLIHEPKETLWNIASRYKDKWNVDVFSAMLAIYKSNLNKFTQQHIGQLRNNSELLCPSRKTISMMGEKAVMKAEFHRLNNISPQ
jgi:hypothetical protein